MPPGPPASHDREDGAEDAQRAAGPDPLPRPVAGYQDAQQDGQFPQRGDRRRRRALVGQQDQQVRGDRADPDELRKVLAEARSKGWAAVDQELEAGVRSIACPIRDSSRKVVAAINASAHAARVPMRTLEKQFLPRLQEAARQIDSELAARMSTRARNVL